MNFDGEVGKLSGLMIDALIEYQCKWDVVSFLFFVFERCFSFACMDCITCFILNFVQRVDHFVFLLC